MCTSLDIAYILALTNYVRTVSSDQSADHTHSNSPMGCLELMTEESENTSKKDASGKKNGIQKKRLNIDGMV